MCYTVFSFFNLLRTCEFPTIFYVFCKGNTLYWLLSEEKKWNFCTALLESCKLPAQGRKPIGDSSPGHTLLRAGSGMKARAQDEKLWKEAGLEAKQMGAWPETGGPSPCRTTFTSSKGNRSWKMRLIRAPPESSSVSTWSPEPSIRFSKSTPNCWTILQGKRKHEH